jgi:IS30 family transposase
MGQEQANRAERQGTHFTWEERLRLMDYRKRLKIKSPRKLAQLLGKSKRTIQREINRGWETFIASDLSTYETYSPDITQRKADENLSAKGPDLKLGNDYALVKNISLKMKEENYSPDAVIMYYEKNGWPSQTRISLRTLYRYIEEGLIPGVSSEDLLHKGKRSNTTTKSPRRHSRAASAKKSITLRPVEAETREEPGHWEMDCVVSGKKKGKEALLTLTERKSRQEIIRKIKDQTSSSVVLELNKLERLYGSRQFRNIFKTITCDNGSEFMDIDGMEKSCMTQSKRTDVYYAHPYCSSERGSNENANGIIRRFIPKGVAIARFSKAKIREIQDWMNNYPRRILGGLSANEACHATMVA